MQFLICCAHDHKKNFPLGFLSATLLAFSLLGTCYYPFCDLFPLPGTIFIDSHPHFGEAKVIGSGRNHTILFLKNLLTYVAYVT